MDKLDWPWEVLDLAPTFDAGEIKRAYAKKLRGTRPEDGAQAFQQLREAYEFALRQAQLEARAAPAEPATAAVRSNAMAQAQALWDAFLADAPNHTCERLALLANGDAMLRMEVRECFEICAVHHCARAECAAELRAACVAHFEWDTRTGYIEQHAPAVAQELRARARADWSYAHFTRSGEYNPDVVRLLLADRIPASHYGTNDGSFIREMKLVIGAIEEFHPEMLALKLDCEVFEWWRETAYAKRYFEETAFVSLIVGFILWGGLCYLLSQSELAQRAYGVPAFFVAQFISFTSIAWLVLRPRDASAVDS